MADQTGVIPLDQLRADDSRIGADGFLDEQPDRVGPGSHVVVTDGQERDRAFDFEGLVGGAGEPGITEHPVNLGIR